MIRKAFQIAIATAAIAASTPVFAQSAGTFNCPRLLVEAGFLNTPPGQEGLTLYGGGKANLPGDPVSVREIIPPRGEPFLLTHLPSNDGQQGLGCKLIVVEFYDTYDATNNLALTASGSLRVPLLLVRPFLNRSEAERGEADWRASNYSIVGNFRGGLSQRDKNFEIELSGYYLAEPKYLSLRKFTKNSSRILRNISAFPGIAGFLDDAEVPPATPLLVLCGGDSGADCDTIKPFVEADYNKANGTTTPVSFGATVESRPNGVENTEVLDKAPDPAPTVGPAQKPVTTKVRLTDRSLKDISDFGIDRRECVIQALGGQVFRPTGICAGNPGGMALLANLNALIEADAEGNWVLVAGAAIEAPKLVVLDVAPGFAVDQCLFDLFYTDDKGSPAQIQIEYGRLPTGGTGLQGKVSAPFQILGGEVSATLKNVSQNSDCPIEELDVRRPAAETLRIKLEAPGATVTGLAHLFLVNQADSVEGLKLRANDAADLARRSVDAVQAAHFRVSQTHPDQIWSLDQARLGVFEGRGTYKEWKVLDQTDLRNRVPLVFGDITDERDALFRNTAVVDANSLVDAISGLQDEATEAGLTQLTVTLLSYVLRDEISDTVDLCSLPSFQDALDRLNARQGVPVTLEVFPIVRHAPEQRAIVTDNLQPRGFSAASLGEGGAYSCRLDGKGMAVHPFIVEPWRDSVDVATRYASALSDQLAIIIEDSILGVGAKQ